MCSYECLQCAEVYEGINNLTVTFASESPHILNANIQVVLKAVEASLERNCCSVFQCLPCHAERAAVPCLQRAEKKIVICAQGIIARN